MFMDEWCCVVVKISSLISLFGKRNILVQSSIILL